MVSCSRHSRNSRNRPHIAVIAQAPEILSEVVVKRILALVSDFGIDGRKEILGYILPQGVRFVAFWCSMSLHFPLLILAVGMKQLSLTLSPHGF